MFGRIGHALAFQQRLYFCRCEFFAGLRRFFKNGVLCDFVDDHVFQLQAVELQDRDHLNQARREYLLLVNSQVQPLRKRTHSDFSLTPENAFPAGS